MQLVDVGVLVPLWVIVTDLSDSIYGFWRSAWIKTRTCTGLLTVFLKYFHKESQKLHWENIMGSLNTVSTVNHHQQQRHRHDIHDHTCQHQHQHHHNTKQQQHPPVHLPGGVVHWHPSPFCSILTLKTTVKNGHWNSEKFPKECLCMTPTKVPS